MKWQVDKWLDDKSLEIPRDLKTKNCNNEEDDDPFDQKHEGFVT